MGLIKGLKEFVLGAEREGDKGLSKEIWFGDGLSFDNGKPTRIAVPDAHRSGHFWCFGTTRVGKTRMLENMAEEDIRKGYNVVIIDPKGDVELFSKISQVALEAGRKNDLMLLTPIFPEHSIKVNPLEYYYMIEELVGHIMAGVEGGKEPFFYNVSYEASLMATQSKIHSAIKKGESSILTFKDVMDITGRPGMEKLKEDLESFIDDEQAERLLRDLNKILESPADYYSKISSTLRVTLMELTQGNVGQVIGNVRGNRVIERLENGQGVILVCQVGSLLTRRAAFTVGKVMLSTIAALVGRTFSSGLKLNPPLCLYVDEAQSILYRGIEDLFAKAGGAGVWLHCFSQSINQIYDALGSKDSGNSILDNINTKVFMRAPDEQTAEYVVKHFGQGRKYSPIIGTSSGGSITMKETVEDLLAPENVLYLKPRQFFMTTYNGRYRGETRSVSELLLEIIFPKIENRTV